MLAPLKWSVCWCAAGPLPALLRGGKEQLLLGRTAVAMDPLPALWAGTEFDKEDTDQEQSCLKDRLLRDCPPDSLVTLQRLDQVLGDASWMEGVMINTQFT